MVFHMRRPLKHLPSLLPAIALVASVAMPAPRAAGAEIAASHAEACAASADSLMSGLAAERDPAGVVLDRLALFHGIIIAMNMERRLERAAAPAARAGLLASIPQVSPAGEFLIAHRVGLIDALEAWIGTGADFSHLARVV